KPRRRPRRQVEELLELPIFRPIVCVALVLQLLALVVPRGDGSKGRIARAGVVVPEIKGDRLTGRKPLVPSCRQLTIRLSDVLAECEVRVVRVQPRPRLLVTPLG